MKHKQILALAAALFAATWLPLICPAQVVNTGSTGSDGALDFSGISYTTNIVINMANHPNGIYQYTTVTIPTNVTVTFIPNANNTPVTWLLQGSCVISGTVDVSGQCDNGLVPGQGGPGGGAGGYGGQGTSALAHRGAGLGGGDAAQYNVNSVGGGGSYATVGSSSGAAAGMTYGNSFLLPLLGGSGGNGSTTPVTIGSTTPTQSNPITATCTPSPVSSATTTSVTWTITNTAGGAGGSTYTYQWPTFGSTVGGTGTSQAYTLSSSYAPTVIITDSANNTASLTCQMYTNTYVPPQNNNSVPFPVLWPGQSVPTTDVTFRQVNNVTVANPPPTVTTIRPGSNVTVSYNTAGLTSCNGIVTPSAGGTLDPFSNWNNTAVTGTLDSIQFSGLSQGVYKLYYSCQESLGYTNSNPIMAALHNLFASNPPVQTVYSNPVEIDVVTSTIHEK